jgi:hypothetical protein
MVGIKKIVNILCFLILAAFLFSSSVFAGASQSMTATSPGSDTVPADGVTTASLTLTIQGGSGHSVTISIASDPTAVIMPTTATLDANGQAIFTFTSTTVGSDAVDVTDTTTSTSYPSLGIVVFTSVSSGSSGSSGSSSSNTNSSNVTSTCNSETPSSAPNLYQVSMKKSTATLYFTPASGVVDGYIISYGLTSNADSYSVTFSQGASSGAITYKVNSLISNGIYYFKVRATNGCARGAWSNIKSSSSLTTLPKTGPPSMLFIFGMGGMAVLLTGLALFAL